MAPVAPRELMHVTIASHSERENPALSAQTLELELQLPSISQHENHMTHYEKGTLLQFTLQLPSRSSPNFSVLRHAEAKHWHADWCWPRCHWPAQARPRSVGVPRMDSRSLHINGFGIKQKREKRKTLLFMFLSLSIGCGVFMCLF